MELAIILKLHRQLIVNLTDAWQHANGSKLLHIESYLIVA